MMTLEWDKTPRLNSLMPLGFGAERNNYTEAVGRCFVMGMAARVLNPGCKVDNMPVLEGPQGGFKSSALEALGGAWFSECHEPVTSKDFFQIMQGRMLIEISELHAFRRSEVERIKGIISCRIDRYRKSYGRRAEDHPRTSVFAGTTNVDDWNADETGARRFWPIRCGVIEPGWIKDNRAQLFAEAVELVTEENPHWDVPEGLAKIEQHARRKYDEWEAVLRRFISHDPEYDHNSGGLNWVERIEPLTESRVLDFLVFALQIQEGKIQRADQMRAAACFKAIGWERKRAGSGWIYVPPADSRHTLIYDPSD
jgi:putative DNA primase/helicase